MYTYTEMSDGFQTRLKWTGNFHIARVEEEFDRVKPLSDYGAVTQWMLKPSPVRPSQHTSQPHQHQLNLNMHSN